MNVLYFTLEDFDTIQTGHSINKDLLREFQRHGHSVYVVSPTERRKQLPTRLLEDDGKTIILKPRIGNLQKTRNFIEKGISTVTIGWLLKRAIKKYLSAVKFDLVIYCTPPITFLSAIEYVKSRDRARTYLLLKDIFPDSAVDLGFLKKTGLAYKYFRRIEKKFYAISDRIGCMSQANVDYVLKHNPKVDRNKVEICPNCIESIDNSINEETRIAIRRRYTLPLDKKIFIYGGNLGKPQGIPFLIECLRTCSELDDCWFLVVGDGTELHLLVDYVEKEHPQNVILMRQLPPEEYDNLVAACDVGLIFLDHRFTIPNFPSRLLSYMRAGLPVIACTDTTSDVGKVIEDGGFGWWCESNDVNKFFDAISLIKDKSFSKQNEFQYLGENYSTQRVYRTILNKE